MVDDTAHDKATTDSDDEPLPDDLGGMPFDDDFGEDEDVDIAADGDDERGAGPAYDSGKKLQARGIKYPSATPAGMKQLKSFTRSKWGGADLGTLATPPRTFRGGGSPSLHNWGMAWDWRWGNPGPGRATADAVIEFYLDRANELGIQAIHDYAGGRYWKSYAGWRDGTTSSSTGMGQSWAQWLHIERTWASANDDRTIQSALDQGGKSSAASTPTTTSSSSSSSSSEDGRKGLILPDPTIGTGMNGANVAHLQDFLQYFKFATFARTDGEFGPRTLASVQNAQRHFTEQGWYSAKIDGEFGPKSAAAAAKVISGL